MMFPISLKTLSDQERHDYILKTYILNKTQSSESKRYKRDIDVIKENHRFLWDETVTDAEDTWETRLARRYYDKLFKEYCIADLTRHKENKVALRWRTEAEVIAGIGQFQCGSRKCEHRDELRSWEVNFAYYEQGGRKNALVKLRLCPEHSLQLNYTSKKREVKRLRHAERLKAKEEKRDKRRQRKNHKIDGSKASTSSAANASESGEDDDTMMDEFQQENSVDDENDTATTSTAMENESETTNIHAEDIWTKKLELDAEVQTRETDFERYLEDLLL